MWIDRLTSSPALQALELATQFTEQRHRVLAENVANLDTPGYQQRRLDPGEFHRALRMALEAQTAGPAGRPGPLRLAGSEQIAQRPDGRLETRPALRPAENVLLHDGTNAQLEALMSAAVENRMSHEFATNLLKSRFDGLMRAVRGRTT